MLKLFTIAAAIILSAVPALAEPIIIAHRGASGERPEHTLAAYERAIDQGANYVEPDLVMTRDGVLVARHENEISGTTDVAAHPAFADRKKTKVIDGESFTGWFTEDFTLSELRTLRARERLPELRAANVRFDGLYSVPTLDEVIRLVKAKQIETGRTIGIYPEIKHPSHFAALGLDMGPVLLRVLAAHGYAAKHDAVFIQSFEPDSLKKLRPLTKLRLVQLIPDADLPLYAGMTTATGLKALSTFVDGIGVQSTLVLPVDAKGMAGPPTGLVAQAHAAGLVVHIWTLRAENIFLPKDWRIGTDNAAHGEFGKAVRTFTEQGVDGIFTDFPGQAVKALNR